MLHVFARVKSTLGHEDELRAILQELVRASCAEPGVLTYELFETLDHGEFIVREVYADKATFDRHMASHHFQTAASRATPILDGGISLWVVNPVGAA